jgi:hypothetical protein
MSNGILALTADLKLSIMNPLNPNIEAAYISCMSNTSFKIDMNSDFSLIGKT